MAFHVGQKVVCVDAGEYSHQIQNGKIYKVVDTTQLPDILRIDHWVNDLEGGNGWAARRFRPLVEKKSSTDAGMAILREILERESVEKHVTNRVSEQERGLRHQR